MMITSLQNSLVKKVNTLKTGKGRKANGQYILEGVKPVQEALRAGKLAEIIICPELIDIGLIQTNQELIPVNENVFQNISTLETPEGVMAILSIEKNELQKLSNENFVVLCGVQDPGNVGTLMRSAEAFGFTQIVFLDNTADPYQPKATRASMGSILRVQTFFGNNEEFLSIVDSKKLYLLGLDVSGQEISRNDKLSKQPFGLVVGSESHGIHPDILAKLSKKMRIPMVGEVESLNAAIAGSAMMLQIFLQRDK